MIIATLVAAAVAVLVALWVIQLRTRDAATVDVGWAVLVAGGALSGIALVDGDATRRWLVGTLAFVWAVRLGVHLLGDRVFRDSGEDGRYRYLREYWGSAAPRNFLFLYLAQAVIAALFIAPIVAAMQGGPLDSWAVAGVVVWLVSVCGEAISDGQLARFRAQASNKGRVCRAGLWKYSRHPNYFFEWLHWFSYVLIGNGALLTWLGPAAMLLFLFRITGIPYTEQQALRSRGDAYRDYQRTTSVFLPLPNSR